LAAKGFRYPVERPHAEGRTDDVTITTRLATVDAGGQGALLVLNQEGQIRVASRAASRAVMELRVISAVLARWWGYIQLSVRTGGAATATYQRLRTANKGIRRERERERREKSRRGRREAEEEAERLSSCFRRAATARGRGVAVRYGGGIPYDEGETDTVRALVGQSRFPWVCRILTAPARESKQGSSLAPCL
jgi:hypothetical protein